jgi:hypothetical protein
MLIVEQEEEEKVGGGGEGLVVNLLYHTDPTNFPDISLNIEILLFF